MTNLSGTNLNNGAAVGPQGEGRESPSNFPTYPAYKDSGVEWLGEVPESWTVTLLKRGYEVVLGKMLQPEAKRDDDEFLPYLRAANIQVSGVDISDVKKMWFGVDEKKSLLLRRGDLLVSEGGDVGRSAIWDFDEEFYFQNSINRIRSIAGNDTRFLYFWMITIKNNGYVDVLCNKSTIAHFTAEKVAAVPLPIPSIHEQTQIARFLDHETARIDALIEEQQRLIELLKEKRQAVISHAVTKGLDPTVPMKDSGVEWLGEVPAHWNVGALRWYATIQGGIAKGKDYEGRETVVMPYLRVANVQSGFVDLTEVKEISVLESEVERYSLRAGDVLMNEGGDNDKLGRGTVWQAQIEPCLHQNHVFAIRPNGSLRAEWLATFTQSEQARTYFYLNSKQSTNLASISASNVMSLALPIPSVSEQQEILAYLEEDRERHEQLAGVAISTVELLQERRSALISAAVTGKIDVRGWQPPASSQAPKFEVAEAN
ncbi:restriction endonuclease subunit S [Pseudomonas aeruginosa]|uniref:restriction endonuclease subunit S n=1 Tax=Pseudomonas aeruginosa TaxID=287 RepID=UPI000DECF67C|nr:restriction endonuclease subunit S [Pseudomonas aeruginosa]RCI61451.1 restriction endonuclease subunit S [Pseudomonas aeruginosa]